MIPYGRQSIDDEDIRAVTEVLRSDWLTTGPAVDRFERAVADYCGEGLHGVAVNSGTAALHAAMAGIGVEQGDEVIVPPMTFAATANCVVYRGARPVFVDVEPDTLLIDPEKVRKRITPWTKAVIGVDYTGHPCDWDALRALADEHGLKLVADACHALGAEYRGRRAGTLADVSVFSFHPVKHIATGEGGMCLTADEETARRMRTFRNHGITTDARERAERGGWFYEMRELGFNYRLPDILCALGASQMNRLDGWLARRREIAARYGEAFADMPGVTLPTVREDVLPAWHIYVLRVNPEAGSPDRAEVFRGLRERGLGVNVHYIPVHLHPWYRRRLGTSEGLCPVAEEAYERILTIPLFPAMSDSDVDTIIAAVRETIGQV